MKEGHFGAPLQLCFDDRAGQMRLLVSVLFRVSLERDALPGIALAAVLRCQPFAG